MKTEMINKICIIPIVGTLIGAGTIVINIVKSIIAVVKIIFYKFSHDVPSFHTVKKYFENSSLTYLKWKGLSNRLDQLYCEIGWQLAKSQLNLIF